MQPSVLSFDLEYDTAEDPGVDVRTLTAAVRRFVQPPRDKPKDPPPLVRFQWGTFLFSGRVTQVTEDIDYFGQDGRPLRAKLSLSITEQDPSLEGNVTGPGARNDDQATSRVAPTGPGLPPGGWIRRRARPWPAWHRSPAAGGADAGRGEPAGPGCPARRQPGELAGPRHRHRRPAEPHGRADRAGGAEIEMSADLGTSLGFAAGGTVGAQSGDDAAEVVGTASEACRPAPSGDRTDRHGRGGRRGRPAREHGRAGRCGAARAAFSVPGAPPAPASDPVDPRLLSYGRALPLRARPQVSTAADSQAGGAVSLTARARPREAPVTAQDGTPWEQLTPGAPGRAEADAAQRARDARPSTMRWRPGGDCR